MSYFITSRVTTLYYHHSKEPSNCDAFDNAHVQYIRDAFYIIRSVFNSQFIHYTKYAKYAFLLLFSIYICVVLGGVVMVVGSSLARGKIFTASIGSVDSLYPSVFIYCMNLHQFLILCSSKAMMFVKLYFRTSDIYLISLVSLDPSGFHLRTK